MAIVNNRLLHAAHLSDLSDVAGIINGIDAGGLMSASIQAGFDDVIAAGYDGFSMPEVDRFTQFVRGSVITQDWIEVLNILAGTVSRYTFYERNSGGPTFRRNELQWPYIHAASINLAHRGRADCSFNFECWFDNTNSDISKIWTTSDLISDSTVSDTIAYSPGLEIETCIHDPGVGDSDIYHVLGFSMTIAGQLSRASADSDVGYTAVDIGWGGQPISGTLTIQDAERHHTLLAAGKADLILVIKMAQGAASKTLTVKDVVFTNLDSTSNSGAGYTGYTLNWVQTSLQATGYGYAADNPFVGDAAGVTIT